MKGRCVILLLVIVASGCAPPARDRVSVFAAASLTDAMDEVAAAFTAQTGIAVRTHYAGSSTLARQIIHGARADVFLSASTAWADALAAEGLVGRRRKLLANRLVVVAPEGRPDFDLPALGSATIRRLAIADPAGVPAGVYAREALRNAGLWPAVEGKLILGAHVRQVLAHVEQGGADAGIVYATDAAMADGVRIVAELPQELHAPIRYALVLLEAAADDPSARALFDFLASPEATAVFVRYGFKREG